MARITFGFQCSSASRKFLNSTTCARSSTRRMVSVLFSEPKIPHSSSVGSGSFLVSSFSALQRAENSSLVERNRLLIHAALFQCSSASRKFLTPPESAQRR